MPPGPGRPGALEAPASSAFVLELLAELRAGGWSPAAWFRFFARSGQRSVEDARSEPDLLRSCLRQSALLAGLALLALRRQWRPRRGLRQARHIALLLLLQQGYVALHLGMAQTEPDGQRFQRLGAANFATLLRGLCAMLLVVADAGDTPLFGLLLAIGGTSDALDGVIARRIRTRSRMGQMLDPMADVAFYSAATWAAVRRGALPAWFGRLTLARFLLPVAAGLYRYFWRVRALRAEHTGWGKLAGALLVALVALSAAQPRLARTLCVPTSAVLLLASALQLRRALDTH